jgi:hypothetical protein
VTPITDSWRDWYEPFLHRHVIITLPNEIIRNARLADVSFNAVRLVLEDGSPMVIRRNHIQSIRLVGLVGAQAENRRGEFAVKPGMGVQT